MDTTQLRGHSIPLITRDQTVGENQRLESDMNSGSGDASIKKSELVEIQTPTARVLYKIIAVYPFDLTPDELIVDEIKVSIIYKNFFSRQYNNILIKDITDILYNSSLFLGALRLNGGDNKDPLTINRLRTSDAQMARRIILGLMIFSDQKVDTSKMSVEEIIQKTSELGRVKSS